MQFCALCGDAIELEGNIATLYFEIQGIGAFEFNIHAKCLIKLGEPDFIKNQESCVFCGALYTDSSFIVRQLDNLNYPVHAICLENLLERFASQFCDGIDEMGQKSSLMGSEDTDDDIYSSQLGLIQYETRN